MSAPIYPTCLAEPAVVALLGELDGSIRLWPFKLAPQFPELPYATWQNVAGTPENNVSDRPDCDYWRLQVNVWGVTRKQVEQVTNAIRDAVEGVSYIVRWGNEDQDAQTKAFGYDFDVDWFTNR